MGSSRPWLFVAVAACNGASNPTDVIVPPHCGDGVLQADEGEECDDGNAVSGDRCSSTCKVESGTTGNVIDATWMLMTVDGNVVPCPSPGDSARVIAMPISGTSGGGIVDNFPCDDGSDATTPLDDGDYRVRIEIRDHDGALFATSLPQDITIAGASVPVGADIITDGGYFAAAWHLVTLVNSMPVSCIQAGVVDIDVVAIDDASTIEHRSSLVCDDGAGLTMPLLTGGYTVRLEAFTAMKLVGMTADVAKQIVGPNMVTDLGTVTIPVGP